MKRLSRLVLVLAAVTAFAGSPDSKFVYRGTIASVNTNASLTLSNMSGAYVHADCHNDGGGVPAAVDAYLTTGFSDGGVSGNYWNLYVLSQLADGGWTNDGGGYSYSAGCKQADGGQNPCPLIRFTAGFTFNQKAGPGEDTVWMYQPDGGICDIYTAIN